MDNRITHLGRTLLRVFDKFSRNEEKPHHFGVDVPLHPSEIHMVMLIGDHSGQHVSELARIAGVTRGAVSQAIAKLGKKGLVNRTAAPDNGLKIVPSLTIKGRVAYWAHEKYHEETDADLHDYVKHLTDEQVAVIEDFLRNMETMVDRRK